jgi:hypothetical protein
MAKYPASFVEAHQFDLIFAKWVMPGVWMLNSGLILALIAVILWIAGRRKAKKLLTHQ